jgi:DNA-binding response OmpR family regulator
MANRSPSPIPHARILVVEDEATTRKAIARALGLLGYEVDEVASGEQALLQLSSLSYDLMLLDLRMPGMDGIEVMKRVQESFPELLVIVLTAHATLESAITAVKAGAIDYLLKPSSIREIEAAISQALKRRRRRLRRQHLIGVIAEALDALEAEEEPDKVSAPSPAERFLQCGSVSLDREKRLVTVAGVYGADSINAELTPSEVALLTCFMQRPGSILSCRELAKRAFDYDVSEREAGSIVRPHVSRLRTKIEPDPDHPQVIRTVRGKGYLFSAY